MKSILVINPGSTSMKIALFHDEAQVWVEQVDHPVQELDKYGRVIDQFDMRKTVVRDVLRRRQVDLAGLAAVAGRGGLLRGARSGAYEVNPDLIEELKYNPLNEHASNLGAWLAYDIAHPLGIPAYIYDPVTVDEMIPIARITGLAGIERVAMCHNLNMRAAAIRAAKLANKPYAEMNIIVAHLGGGISLSLHSGGRVIDVVTDDEGPFSPERAGGLPGYQLIALATAPSQTCSSLMKTVQRRGGLMSHFGTSDAREIERRIDSGDERAALVYEAMALNVARAIGRLAVIVSGMIDCVVLTGGLVRSERFARWIMDRVSFIAPVWLFPGEHEMEALALGVLRVLRGQETARTFTRR